MDKRDVSALLCRETPDDAKGTVHRLDQRIDTVICDADCWGRFAGDESQIAKLTSSNLSNSHHFHQQLLDRRHRTGVNSGA